LPKQEDENMILLTQGICYDGTLDFFYDISYKFTVPQIFGLNIPKRNKAQLFDYIKRNLSSNSQISINFLSVQNLVQLNLYPNYKAVLNRSTQILVQDKLVIWALWRLELENYFGVWFANFTVACSSFEAFWSRKLNNTGMFLLQIFFYWFLGSLFLLNLGLTLAIDLVSLLIFRFSPKTMTKKLEMQQEKREDIVWDILQLANDKQLKVAVVGGTKESEDFTLDLVKNVFPKIHLSFFVKPDGSRFIQDLPQSAESKQLNFEESDFYKPKNRNPFKKILPWILENFFSSLKNSHLLDSQSICSFYSELYQAKAFLKEIQPDIILLSLSGLSGKQEFFAANLKEDLDFKFGLIVGLGEDFVVENKMENKISTNGFSVEKFKKQSLFIFWVAVQQITNYLQLRETVVCIIRDSLSRFLLVKRNRLLPGDLGWAFVQGGVDKDETLEQAACREVFEEVGFETGELQIEKESPEIFEELYPVSLVRTLVLGSKYQGSVSKIINLKYTGTQKPKTNHENLGAGWFGETEVLDILSQEKRVYFQNYL
jgi:hypothetical protein